MNDAEFIVKNFVFMYGSLLVEIGLVYLIIRFINYMVRDSEKKAKI
jgi:hypothetical protein